LGQHHDAAGRAPVTDFRPGELTSFRTLWPMGLLIGWWLAGLKVTWPGWPPGRDQLG
jgi:hypothetical protein